jgi:predicted RND superfamily exporter protein
VKKNYKTNLMNIPLDLMTITISAIAIGIGVDDAIHYIHRFKAEFAQDHDYLAKLNDLKINKNIIKIIKNTAMMVLICESNKLCNILL